MSALLIPWKMYQVGRMTLGGLLALGYTVVVSYKRASTSVIDGNLSVSLETIDTLGEAYLVLRGTSRKVWTFLPSFNNVNAIPDTFI